MLLLFLVSLLLIDLAVVDDVVVATDEEKSWILLRLMRRKIKVETIRAKSDE